MKNHIVFYIKSNPLYLYSTFYKLNVSKTSVRNKRIIKPKTNNTMKIYGNRKYKLKATNIKLKTKEMNKIVKKTHRGLHNSHC